MQKLLAVDTLGDLDQGSARAIINAAIKTAYNDIVDRGEDGKPREVNIKIVMVKMDNGLVIAHVEAGPKLPVRRTGATIAKEGYNKLGEVGLVFQENAPQDPQQGTIIDVAEHGHALPSA